MQEIRLIRPPGRLPKLDLAEALRSRELLWMFVRRGIFTRYRQMALGVLWSFLEPLGLLLLMTIVFGLFLRVPTEPYPYTIFVFSALIPWLYFSKAANGAAGSLHENIGIVSKIYFPRVLLPAAALVREAFDSLVLFVLLVIMAWAFGFPPNLKMLLMPLLLVFLSLPALGIGLAVAAISVKYRDFRPLLTLALQAGFYATPIFYPAEFVPEAIRAFYTSNPIYWGVAFSRWIVLGKPVALDGTFLISLAICAVLIAVGYFMFAFYERGAVDAQ